MPLQVSLAIESLTPQGATLVVSARNDGDAGLYLLDALRRPGPDGDPEPDPHPGYRLMLDETLYVLLGPCPVPSDRNVYHQTVPRATLLPPGEEYQARLAFSVPIEEYALYANGEGQPEMRNCSRIVVALAAVPEAAAEPAPIPDDGGRGTELTFASIRRSLEWSAAEAQTKPFLVSLGLTEGDRNLPAALAAYASPSSTPPT